jgi:MinD-like ATPase involved in chromosome partitioning or flagellar assembly
VLVAVGSVKGSPGATTWALAVAARWPHEPAPVVVELDPAGGDVGSRFGVHDVPGLSSLVTAIRHAPVGDAADYMQRLPVGVDVIVAPPADAAAATTAEFTARGPAVLRELAAVRPVLADVGRLDPASPALSYLDKADELLLVARPHAAELRHLKARAAVLAAHCPVLRLVLVGAGPYRPEEIATYLGLPVAATVPHDRDGAGILGGVYRPGRGWTRRPLLSSARTFALTYPAPVETPQEVRQA